MREITPRPILYAVLYTAIAAVLSVCVMEPVDLTRLVEDEEVKEIIEQGILQSMEKVKIKPDSDDYSTLVAGNKSITGLSTSKYYIIEEFDTDEDFVSVRFVSGNGTRSENLTGIGRVSGGTITGLTNSHWYRVKAAKPLTGNVTYYETSTPPTGTGTQKTISNGEITLDAPEDSYYLSLPSPIAGLAGYGIVKIPSPDGPAAAVTPASSMIKLEGEGTVTDYVFIKNDDPDGINPENFFVLKVTVSPPVGPAEATVTVSFTIKDTDAVITVSGNNISQSAFIASGLTITLTGAPAGATVSWKYDNDEITGGTTTGCTVPFSEGNSATHKYIIPGDHTISVEVIVNGRVYSKEFKIKVTVP